MRTAIIVLLLTTFSAACLGAAEKEFTSRLTPEEYKAAGLDKLTPAERAALDRLVAGEKLASAEAAAAETKATIAATAPAESKPAKSGWIRLLPGTQIEYETVETKLAGEFAGWRGKTYFALENGQTWVQVDSSSYITRPGPARKVWIEPGMLGSFFLRFEGVRPRVKVELVQPRGNGR